MASSSERTLELLSYLASRPGGATFSDIRDRGYTAPTLSRLLKNLTDRGWVVKTEEGAYGLGEASRVLARAVLGQSRREEKVRPLVRELARMTGESAAYYEAVPGGIILLVKEEMADSFHYIDTGRVNRQEEHGFRMALDGKELSVHETWGSAPGFDRIASPLWEPLYDGAGGGEGMTLPSGVAGITFAKGKYTPAEVKDKAEILIRLIREYGF